MHLKSGKTCTTENGVVCYHCCQFLLRWRAENAALGEHPLCCCSWSRYRSRGHGTSSSQQGMRAGGTWHLWGEAFKTGCATSVLLSLTLEPARGRHCRRLEGACCAESPHGGVGPHEGKKPTLLVLNHGDSEVVFQGPQAHA